MNFPKYISIQTTSICNASCVFCPYPETKNLFAPKIMDERLFKKIIDECSGYHNIERLILYMNNEPLTDPYLIERINYSKRILPWVNLHILTNGSMLDDETADNLINSGLDWIGISFQGLDKATIEQSMGIDYNSAFKRINRFISKVKKKKNIQDYLMLTFLGHKYMTLQEKDKAFAFWQNKGITRISYFDKPISRAGNVKNIKPVYHYGNIRGCKSIWADQMLHVVESGKVILCCMDWKREVILGDLTKESINRVWNTKRKKTWEMIEGKKDMPQGFICRRCEEAVTKREESSNKRQMPEFNQALVTNNLGPKAKYSNIIISGTDSSYVLLVVCPMWDVSFPPLGVSYLAAYLEEQGIKTDILDINIQTYTDSRPDRKNLWQMDKYNAWAWDDLFEETLSRFRKEIDIYVDKIIKNSYKIVGFSLYGANVLFSIEVARRLRLANPDIFIVFGGPSCFWLHDHPSMPVRDMVSFKNQRSFIEPGLVDAFVSGEGEKAFLNIVRNHQTGNTGPVPGVIFYNGKSYSKPSPVELIKDLDSIPFPAWDKLQLDLYRQKPSLPLLLGRGCVNRCTFCNDWKLWAGVYRNRTADNIFKELKRNRERFGSSFFQTNDLLLNANTKMLKRLAGLIEGSSHEWGWSGQATINKNMDAALLKRLKRSGLESITYGVESLSERVLSLMNKKYTFDDIKAALKRTKQAGIKVAVNFIVGFPNETRQEFELTKDRLRDLKEYIDEVSSLNPCYITGGTDLELNPKKFSLTLPKESWCYHWQEVKNSNNYKTRKERTKELAAHIRNLGIKVNFTGIYDEKPQPGINDSDSKAVKVSLSNIPDMLIINLPPWSQENPHIGLAFLDSFLQKKGISCRILDLNKSFFLNHPDFDKLWHVENKNFWSDSDTFSVILEIFKQDIDSAVEDILSSGCDLLGFSVVDPKERLTIEFIQRIKEKSPDKKIILGGPATSTRQQRQIFIDTAGQKIDAFVIAEGEETLYELVERLKAGKSLTGLKGCYIRQASQWLYRPRLPVEPLDKIPFPTYRGFDLSCYGQSLLVEWSRGCIGKCAFCKNTRISSGYRYRSAAGVIQELRYHLDNYNIKRFTVTDNILNGNLNNLYNICSQIIENKLNLEWTGQISPHRGMDLDFFKRMQQAGCVKLQIGLESGSDKVLGLMDKMFTASISKKNIQLAKEAGIETEIFIIVGFPGETEKDFKQTYNFIQRNKDFIDTVKSINTLHLIAGTRVYEEGLTGFGMKPLPKDDWHYLWQTHDGNNYSLRKKRAEKLLSLCSGLGIKVTETNIREGKQSGLFRFQKDEPLQVRIESLKSLAEDLQALPDSKVFTRRRRRSFLRWFILSFLSFYILFYIGYFYLYMLIKKKVLLGGRKE
jgi:anaerobic magnesium-protoporphyrin IX monomethyl ester cyclase